MQHEGRGEPGPRFHAREAEPDQHGQRGDAGAQGDERHREEGLQLHLEEGIPASMHRGGGKDGREDGGAHRGGEIGKPCVGVRRAGRLGRTLLHRFLYDNCVTDFASPVCRPAAIRLPFCRILDVGREGPRVTEGRNVRIRSAEEAHRFVNGRQLDHVKVGVFDIDGIMRGKYMSRDKFFSRAREGLRLLRRGAGLGLQRPALRQRAVHRLAHRATRTRRCASCPTPAGAMPFEDDMRSSSASSPSRPRPVCPRGAAAPRARRAPRAWASRSYAGRRVRVLHVQRDAASRCARRATATSSR